MTHQGYFSWHCPSCEQRHPGDLPAPREDVEGATAARR